ncbi:MAG: hypothetical protein ACXWIU_13565, partial [Limisphaerales bacterium]
MNKIKAVFSFGWPYLARYWKRLVIGVLLGFTFGLANASFVWATKATFGRLTPPAAQTNSLSASAQTIALSHATVIDGTGAAPLQDATIIMSGGRITAMGPAAKVKTPQDAQVIDLTGKTIIPGIINAHSHISDDPALKLRHFALYGVTSTIGMGGDGDDVL